MPWICDGSKCCRISQETQQFNIVFFLQPFVYIDPCLRPPSYLAEVLGLRSGVAWALPFVLSPWAFAPWWQRQWVAIRLKAGGLQAAEQLWLWTVRQHPTQIISEYQIID